MVIQQKIHFHNLSVHKVKPVKLPVMIVLFLVSCLLGCLSLLPYSSLTGFYLFKILQVVFFLAAGFFTSKNAQKHQKEITFKATILLATFNSAVIIAVLSLMYALFNTQAWLMAFGSGAAFAIPFCFNISWALFNDIPEKKYELWIPNKTAKDGTSLFLDSLPVKVMISRKTEDLHEGIYMVNIPYYIKLGDFFSRFLYEQNKKSETAIEDKDIKKNRFAWEFFAVDLYGLQQRRLDPNLNLTQNKIKHNTTLRIRRLYEPLKLLSNNQNRLENEIG